jgi:hypothetical protein
MALFEPIKVHIPRNQDVTLSNTRGHYYTTILDRVPTDYATCGVLNGLPSTSEEVP